MKAKLQKTFTPKPADISQEWLVVDATDVPLGRLASAVAQLLRGKHKPTFAPHIDGGDYVVVVNAEKIAISGNKAVDKMYYRHSGFPGGLRELNFTQMRERYPERIIRGRRQGDDSRRTGLAARSCRKLRVYAGPDHPHAAQNPRAYDVRKVNA